ncbi:MAG: glycerol-3-phosphate dehydrogenase subunit GlpB [Caldilineaceae bacterium]|nr:glycerol-3-phosphate dehydrogenase subunit GlpB [Caldilineaceae bacterium]MBP8108045.1 glycerol-3-phosphate dehydrogenase subunit GlpB [Caldilineaceae bacterium]MBP8124860.1 glycerol-3-phosphate dehydrogenase subunit GlpB [Caldilineaceae bacterium]MBP9072840.1 glycerol-3-phosphate dehydrogenase subunit GlpB [Caldilineaceae bacterium]
MTDLLVIGAGLSGLMAAYTAAQAGQKVTVIAKGLGAIHWTPATVDLFGYAPDRSPIPRPLDFIDRLGDDHPAHPYALLGEKRVAAAVATFQTLSEQIGLPYGGAATSGNNLLLPSPAGAARPTFLAPQAQANGDLSRPEPMLIVGFEGLRDFYPHLIAENLRAQGYTARSVLLPFALLTDRHDSNSVQQARGLEEPKRLAALAQALKKAVHPGERIGMPAILGLDHHAQVLADLQSQTGATLFEIPTLPPSVPGMRLFAALRRKLSEMGVSVYPNMTVIDFKANNGVIEWVASETSGRPLKHRAAAYLLATGGILGGGFNSDHTGRAWEVVFDLPLTIPQQRSAWFAPQFLSPTGHPVFNGGVTVNRNFQPTGEGGQPVYANLWAAGNLLADNDAILQRSLEGIAITTGVAAAQAITHPA